MDQKTMKVLSGVIAGFVLLILILFIISSCQNRTITYEKLEKDMLRITKNYYKNNKKELPKHDKDSKVYSLKKMISDGKLKEVTEMFNDEDEKCEGNVTVTNNNGNYLYTVNLSCKNHKTVSLKDKLIEDSLTETGYGLYNINDNYIYRGEVKNNYIKFGENIYRILRINEDGSLKIMDPVAIKNVAWDDRYNVDLKYEGGINEYIVDNKASRLNEALNDYAKNIDKNMKPYVITSDICVGKRSENDSTKNGSTECSKKLENQFVSTLAAYEYLIVSLDENCLTTISDACANYNWLIDYFGWSMTANTENSYTAFTINDGIFANKTSNRRNVYPVLVLTDKLNYLSGKGTETDPYIIK